MKTITAQIDVTTKGNGDLIDLTSEVAQRVHTSGLKNGLTTVFVIGSTAAITTFEYEPGLIQDIRDMFDKLIPSRKGYHHDATWGDANGFSHVRAALQGPSLSIPLVNGRLTLGTWQQVVLAEFDNRPRTRQVVVQIMGE